MTDLYPATAVWRADAEAATTASELSDLEFKMRTALNGITAGREPPELVRIHRDVRRRAEAAAAEIHDAWMAENAY
jgi:hypothetical protein